MAKLKVMKLELGYVNLGHSVTDSDLNIKVTNGSNRGLAVFISLHAKLKNNSSVLAWEKPANDNSVPSLYFVRFHRDLGDWDRITNNL